MPSWRSAFRRLVQNLLDRPPHSVDSEEPRSEGRGLPATVIPTCREESSSLHPPMKDGDSRMRTDEHPTLSPNGVA